MGCRRTGACASEQAPFAPVPRPLLADINIAALEGTAFGRATINGDDEGVGALRLVIALHRDVESAWGAVIGTGATECGRVAADGKPCERHAMYLGTACVVLILKVSVDRSIVRLLLHVEAKVRSASANIDGATALSTAAISAIRDLRHEGGARATKRRLEG